jgi:hypothetical protein
VARPLPAESRNLSQVFPDLLRPLSVVGRVRVEHSPGGLRDLGEHDSCDVDPVLPEGICAVQGRTSSSAAAQVAHPARYEAAISRRRVATSMVTERITDGDIGVLCSSQARGRGW